MRSNKKINKFINKKTKKNNKIKDNLGFHIGISNGILNGLKYGKEECNVNSMQIFAGSNRSASLKTKTKLTDNEMKEIKKYIKLNKINLFIHSVYVINLCAFPASSKRSHYMHDNIIYDLNLANNIGCIGVVIHLGSSKTLSINDAINNLVSNINMILSKIDKNNTCKLILETSSGQGTQIGVNLEDFYNIYKMIDIKYRKKIGICIDTCHIFASGIDIRNFKILYEYLNKVEKYFKPSKILLIHLNDNPFELGSRRDLHEIIGKGEIFKNKESKKNLKWLIKWCYKKNISIVLETSGAGYPDSNYCNQINYLRNL